MSSIGETLRRERLRRNLDLEQISRELKISSRFLNAIEAEQFDRLPAGVFAKAFVRQYARLLDLDEEELAAEVQRRMQPPALTSGSTPDVPPLPEIQVPKVDSWETVSDRGRFEWGSVLPALALVVVVMLVCSGVYAFWQRSRQTVAIQTPPPAVETRPAAPPPIAVPAPQQPEQQQAQAETPPARPPANTEPAAQQAARTDETATAPKAQPAAEPAPNPNASVRVRVTAEEAVWIMARADGKYLFSGTLDANQSRTAEANEKLTLRLGNAGGVTVTLNGKPVGPFGPKGQVREVQFTAGGFQVVAPPKPAQPDERPI